MTDLITAITNLIPPQYRPLAFAIGVLLPRGFYAYSQGGNLRSVLSAMFLGTNTPPPASPPLPPPAAPKAPDSRMMAILLLCALALPIAGCSTSTEYKVAATTAVTVDAAMTAYGDFLETNTVPDATRAKVRDAYVRYQNAMAVLADAEEVSADTSTNAVVINGSPAQTAAIQAASQALTDLVTLLQSIGVKLQ